MTYEDFNLLLQKRHYNLKIKEFLAHCFTSVLSNVTNKLKNQKDNVTAVDPEFIKVDNTSQIMSASSNDFTFYKISHTNYPVVIDKGTKGSIDFFHMILECNP